MVRRLNVILLLVSILMLAACTNEAQQRLAQSVERTALSCPITMAAGIAIDSISYSDNQVTYYITTTDQMLSVAALKAHLTEVKPAVLEAIKASTDTKVLADIEMIRQAEASVQVVISDGQDEISFTFTADEL